MAFHDPRPLGFLHFPCFSDALFLILLGGKALAHGQERGQWKGETAPKHIWQLSQSLAGEMGNGKRNRNRHTRGENQGIRIQEQKQE